MILKNLNGFKMDCSNEIKNIEVSCRPAGIGNLDEYFNCVNLKVYENNNCKLCDVSIKLEKRMQKALNDLEFNKMLEFYQSGGI